MDVKHLRFIKEEILADYGFVYKSYIHKWVNEKEQKFFHAEWVEVVGTSDLIASIKEILQGSPELKRLKDLLTEVGLYLPPESNISKEIDKILYKTLGDKWLNA